MPVEPKHRRISNDLLTEIAAGKYAPSGRLPSEAQLVERYDVSRPTVARALRDLQEQGLIERRVGAGSFVVDAASAPPAAVPRQFGLLIPGLGTTEIFEAVCGELAGLARVHDYGLLWGGGAPSFRKEDAGVEHAEALCEQFVQRKVDGVFFAPFEHLEDHEEVNRRLVERLRRAGAAVVLLDRDLAPFPNRSEYDLVGIDNFAGGWLLADHLLKLGCRRLAFVAPPHSAPTVGLRAAGAREAMLARGVPIPDDLPLLHAADPQDPDLAHRLRALRVDGVLCANDRVAAMLLRTLAKAGIHVPHTIRVAGFDDVKYAGLLSTPLTTMHQPCREIAAAAFRAMLDRIADPGLPPRSVTLAVRLVVRESCGAYLPRLNP